MKKDLKAIALTLRTILFLIWDVVVTPLSNEPRIWQKRDQLGNIWWYVYDSISGCSIQLPSEQEERQCLEKRFFHH